MKRVLLMTGLLAGCANLSGDVEPCLGDLADALTGTFPSAAQAEADAENFFNIRLVMEPIWQHPGDGPWLYVEQAAASNLDQPYRQRVYHLVELGDGRFLSEVYTLPGDPLQLVRAWENQAVINAVDPDALTLRTGCSITLTYQSPGQYQGPTDGKGCESTLGGAAYATSEVTLSPGVITSWDRGWNADDTQAWGGPYVFERSK